jgi:tellurite methyltransferase
VTDRREWDARHRDAAYDRSPSPFLLEVLPLLPKGRALDLACGSGPDAVFLARHGYSVEALDWSVFALGHLRARCPEVRCIACDLTRYPLPKRRYDLVVCIRFLDRALFREIPRALKPGGALVYETFTRRYLEQRPDFCSSYCLEEGELRSAFAPSLRTERYRESLSPALASLLAFREPIAVRPEAGGRSRKRRGNVSRRRSDR